MYWSSNFFKYLYQIYRYLDANKAICYVSLPVNLLHITANEYKLNTFFFANLYSIPGVKELSVNMFSGSKVYFRATDQLTRPLISLPFQTPR